MDNKYYHWGSGEVVEPKYSEGQFMWDYLASLPVIGKMEIPDYPVGWVGDDVEMVWQVRIRKSMEWFNTEKEIYDKWLKEIYDKWLTDGAKEDLRRILFLPVNKVTIKSESHVDLSGVEFVQPGEKKPFIVANVREILDYWNNGEGCTFSRMVEMFNEVAARQQSAAEIDRLRGEVERLTRVVLKAWDAAEAAMLKSVFISEKGDDILYSQAELDRDWQQFKKENNIL